MTWVRTDDGAPEHRKFLELGDRIATAGWLWFEVLCACNRSLTDGVVPARLLRGADPTDVDALVRVGLWERQGDAIVIHDYLDYQPSQEKVLADRVAAKERMKRIRVRPAAPVRPNNTVHVAANTPPNDGASFPHPVPAPVPVSESRPDPARSPERRAEQQPVARRPRVLSPHEQLVAQAEHAGMPREELERIRGYAAPARGQS